MDMNLYEAIKERKTYLPEAKVRSWMYQLVLAVDHMHSKGVFHRDIKPENILVKDDSVKLADFGSCRGTTSKPPLTEYISTRWYRAPECLLTDGYYSQEIDIWGIGCVFFEMLSLYPLFPGEKNEANQIDKIFQTIGPPPASLLEKWKRSCSHMNFSIDLSIPRKSIASKLPHISKEGIEFIESCLIYDPDQRITAAQARNHPYFRELRDSELRRYRQVSSIRTREKERESSYEGDSSAGSMQRGANNNVSVININISQGEHERRRGNKYSTKKTLLDRALANKKSQVSDESDYDGGITELPPLHNRGKAGLSLSKKPRKQLAAIPQNDNSAGLINTKTNTHISISKKINDHKKNYVSPYSQKAIKGSQAHGDY